MQAQKNYFITSFYKYRFVGEPGSHHLSNSMRKRGFRLTDAKDADFYIALDFTLIGLLRAIGKGVRKSRRILIIQEPKVVLPQNHWHWVRQFFGHVLQLGKPEEEGHTFVWPQDFSLADEVRVLSGNRNIEQAAMVVSKRLSIITGEQYSLRARLVERPEVDTFGRDWNRGSIADLKSLTHSLVMGLISFDLEIKALFSIGRRPKNYYGELGDKISALTSYGYTIVVENSNEYHSEKLFEAFFAGCFPIYVGPNPRGLGIPDEFFRLASPSEKEVLEALEDAKELDLGEFREKLALWLSSPKTSKFWSANSVWDRVADSILRKLCL